MCVCYTNHALDQFLEALLDKGIQEIVRIGSRSKSKRLEQYNLRELENKTRGQNLSLAENRRFSLLHRELEQVQERAEQLAELLTSSLSPQPAPAGASSNGPDGGSAAGSSAGPGGVRNPGAAAAAAAAVNAAWQARSEQLRQQEEKARKARLDKARQQGRS